MRETIRDCFISGDENSHAHHFMHLFWTYDPFQYHLSVHRISMLPSQLTINNNCAIFVLTIHFCIGDGGGYRACVFVKTHRILNLIE